MTQTTDPAWAEEARREMAAAMRQAEAAPPPPGYEQPPAGTKQPAPPGAAEQVASAFVARHGEHLIQVADEFYFWGQVDDTPATSGGADLRQPTGWRPIARSAVRYLAGQEAVRQHGTDTDHSDRLIQSVVARVADATATPGYARRDPAAPAILPWDRQTGETLPGVPWSDHVVAITADHKVQTTPLTPEVVCLAGTLPLHWDGPDGHPRIDALLADWFPAADERAWFEAVVVGRTLALGIQVHALPVLIGEGGAGKSTLLDLLTRMVGHGRTDQLGGGLASLGDRFATGFLETIQLLVVPELPQLRRPTTDERKALTTLKSLSGGDEIKGEKKGGGKVVVPGVCCLLASNHPPLFLSGQDDASAWLRRLHLFELAAIPAAKKRLSVLDEIGLDELSAWGRTCLYRFVDLLTGALAEPPVLAQRREQLLTVALTPADLWVQQNVIPAGLDPGAQILGAQAYQSWHLHAMREGHAQDEIDKSWRYITRQISAKAAPPPAGKNRERYKLGVLGADRYWTIWRGVRLAGADAVEDAFAAAEEERRAATPRSTSGGKKSELGPDAPLPPEPDERF